MSELTLEKNNRHELPAGWIKTTLGQICEPSNRKFNPLKETNTVYIGLEHIESNTGKILGKGKSSNTKSTKTIFKSGDILYGKLRPYLNKVYVPNFDGVCSTDILVFQNNQYLKSKYLALFLSTKDFVRLANHNVTGIQHPRVSYDTIAKFDFPLPPLNEQKRIVSKIEELLSQLDTIKKSLEEIKMQLEQNRFSLFKLTFEGKNTEKWNSSNLVDICMKITDGEHFKPNYISKGVPFLTAKNVQDEGVIFTNTNFISKTDAEKSRKRCNPEQNDILMVSRGATVGRTCLINTDKEFCLLGSVILIKPSNIIPKFLSYFLKSPNVQRRLIKVSGSTAQQAIYLRDIGSILISFPTLEEQNRIISQFEFQLSVIENNQKIVNFSLDALNTIRISILKSAFEGKLISQDPNDEPASILLEKIKQEKEKLQEIQKINKTKSFRSRRA